MKNINAFHRKLRSVTQGTIVINMCLSLIGMYTMYLVAGNGDSFTSSNVIRGDILCVAVGALLYYFMLVYFMWTAVEAIDLYNKLVKIFNQGSKTFPIYGGIIAWGEKCPLSLMFILFFRRCTTSANSSFPWCWT